MRILPISATILLLSTVCSAQFLDSRNRAMGGTGVASSHYSSAGFINPALLTHFGETDDFCLIFPSIGVSAIDKDGLIGAIENFQDSIDVLAAKIDNATVTPADRTAVANSLNALDGKQANLNFNAGFSLAIPSDTFACAIVAHSYVDARVTPEIDPSDVATINGALSGSVLDSLKSEGRILGAMVSEVGFAVATDVSLLGLSLSIGATPKMQRIDTYNYSIGINSFEDGFSDFSDNKYRNESTKFNLDLGVATSIFDDTLTIGIAGRNLIEHELETVVTSGATFTRHIGPSIKAGAALRFGGATLAADIDIEELDRFKIDDGSRFLNVGAEYNLLGWLQVRGGYQTDLEDTIDDIVTAGLGVSPFDIFHVDLTAIYGEGDTYGAMLQFWFTF